eukprot:jgi/Tetstr1/441342/TSEL_029593.t1
MAVEELTMAPGAGLFRPGRRDGRGFAWTSHSLRKGATTAAYVTGVMMQKIKYSIGGWAMEFSMVLDYIDPTMLPCPAAWHLF